MAVWATELTVCWAVFASGAHVDWDQSEQTVPGSKTTHRFRKRFRKRGVCCGFVDGVPFLQVSHAARYEEILQARAYRLNDTLGKPTGPPQVR